MSDTEALQQNEEYEQMIFKLRASIAVAYLEHIHRHGCASVPDGMGIMNCPDAFALFTLSGPHAIGDE